MSKIRDRIAAGFLCGALPLAGCSAQEKFEPVGPDLSLPTPATAAPTTTAPALVPYTGDGFTIGLPGPGTVQKHTTQSAGGPVETTFVTAKTGGGTEYALSYNSVAYKGSLAKVDLDRTARDTATGAKGTLADLRTVTHKGHPGRDIRVDGAGGSVTLFTRIILAEQRSFNVMVAIPGQHAAPPDLYRQVVESLSF